jgi:hypothetical protein
MRVRHWHATWMTAIALSTSITTTGTLADEAETPALKPVAAVIPFADPLETVLTAEESEVERLVVSSVDLPAQPQQPCCTPKQRQAATEKMKGAFKGLFYANDFSYLSDPCYCGPSFFGDGLKGLCCNKLDVGGELRLRYHNEKNMRGLGLTGRDDNFWLTRYRMFANYRMNKHIRLYGEYLYADSGGEDFASRPIEENRGDILNLFVDAKLSRRTTVRIGRQELLYGNQRLVSPLDWANTRRTFEGVKAMYDGCVWDVDAFWTHPVDRIAATENKIDKANEDIDFFGVYATRDDLSVGTLDAYYLGLVNDVLDYNYHTLGSRVAGKSSRGTLYEFEGGVQFGENSPSYGDHFAGFFTGGLGRQLNVCLGGHSWKPTVWLWYDWASGGDDVPAARGDDGFDHAFPLAHKYLGLMDLFGRRNINDVNAQLITPIGKKMKLMLWYHYFFLDQKTTPYNVTMSPFNPANPAGDRELGHELDIVLNVDINPRHNFLFGYSYFAAGDYYDTTVGIPNADPARGNGDAQFIYTQYQMRF